MLPQNIIPHQISLQDYNKEKSNRTILFHDQ